MRACSHTFTLTTLIPTGHTRGSNPLRLRVRVPNSVPVTKPVPVDTGTDPSRVWVRVSTGTPAGLPVQFPTYDTSKTANESGKWKGDALPDEYGTDESSDCFCACTIEASLRVMACLRMRVVRVQWGPVFAVAAETVCDGRCERGWSTRNRCGSAIVFAAQVGAILPRSRSFSVFGACVPGAMPQERRSVQSSYHDAYLVYECS